jgi:HEAT repeat protein
MNCQEINMFLDAHSLEELSIERQQAIEQHLQSCAACHDDWEAYREVSLLQIPETPRGMHSRIMAAIAPTKKPAIPRSIVLGGVLAVGAALAAAVAFRFGGGGPETARHVGVIAPVVEPAPPAGQEPQQESTNPVEDAASADKPANSSNGRTDNALDPNSIVIVLVLHPELDPRRAALLAQFHEEILRQLRVVPGLNVVQPEVVESFLQSGIPEEQIARNLGAGHLVVLSTTSGPSASLTVTPVDMMRGAATGKMGGSGPFDAKWPTELESDAAWVADFIKEGLTSFTPAQRQAAATDARAIVLNAALPVRERVTALGEVSRTPDARTDAVVAAAVELAAIAPEWRASIWRSMYGVENPYLVEPLIDSLTYDSADHIRRQAAASLHTFVAAPRAKAALAQAQANDPSEIVREAARRALSTDEEVDQQALQKLLDVTLPDRERLMATSLLEGPSARSVQLTEEGARAVFDIGLNATDPGIRGSAWSRLGRSKVDDPSFTSVLLDDLANHPTDEVRSMAAYALAQYIDDPAVREALDQAENDASFVVRYAARKALGKDPL